MSVWWQVIHFGMTNYNVALSGITDHMSYLIWQPIWTFWYDRLQVPFSMIDYMYDKYLTNIYSINNMFAHMFSIGASLKDRQLELLCGSVSGIQVYGKRYLLVRFKTNIVKNRYKGFKIAYWGEISKYLNLLHTVCKVYN